MRKRHAAPLPTESTPQEMNRSRMGSGRGGAGEDAAIGRSIGMGAPYTRQRKRHRTRSRGDDDVDTAPRLRPRDEWQRSDSPSRPAGPADRAVFLPEGRYAGMHLSRSGIT